MSLFSTLAASAIWWAISEPLPAASASSCEPDTVASRSLIWVTLLRRMVGCEGPLASANPSTWALPRLTSGKNSVCQSKMRFFTLRLRIADMTGVSNGSML